MSAALRNLVSPRTRGDDIREREIFPSREYDRVNLTNVTHKLVIRTGVTLISPAKDCLKQPKCASIWPYINSVGEMTGYHTIEERGKLDGFIAITGTLNVGAVMEGLQRRYYHEQKNGAEVAFPFHIPIIVETLDARLSDVYAFPIYPEDIFDIKLSVGVEEDNIGGGTGTITFGFKDGIGNSFRLLPVDHGRLRNLRIKKTIQYVANDTIDVLFNVAADAVEEAVLNALAAAETMTGLNGYTARQVPLENI